MTTWLKQSTATDVEIGPFVDDTDGKTPETALTLSQADCQLIKNGGAAAQKNDATSATHLAGGHYKVPLNATDTGTLGRLRLYINESGALPAWRDFMVVPANVWDSMFGADLLDVSVVQWTGTAVATPATAGYPAVTVKSGTGTGEINLSSGNLAGSVASVTGAVGSVTGNVGGNVTGSVGSVATGGITAGSIAADAIGASELAADAVAEIADAVWDEARSGHVSAGSFGEGVVVNSVATGAITAGAIAADAIGASELAADAATEIGTAVWATAARTLTAATNVTSTGAAVPITAGGLVSADVTAISTDTTAANNAESFFDGTGYAGTNNVIPSVTAVGSVSGAVGSVTGNVGGNVTGSVGSLAAQAKADVNAEVLDVLGTDTFAEPSGVPAATSSLKDKVGFIFAALRNKHQTTATTDVIRNDADSAAIGTAALAEDGTTFTRGEYA